MAQVDLPLDAQDPASSVEVSLGGVALVFAWAWNVRAEAWTCELRDTDGTLLARSPLRAGRETFARFLAAKRIPGVIVVADLEGEGKDPGRDDLGTRVRVSFLDGDDVTSDV